MDEKKLQEIMEDEEFVKELVQLKTKEEVQKLFKTKGLEIDINELEKLENEGKKMLQDSDLENISGGVDMKIKVASCVLALLPFASSIPARAASVEATHQPTSVSAPAIQRTEEDFEEIIRQAKEEDRQAWEITMCALNNNANRLKQLLTEDKYNINARTWGRRRFTALMRLVSDNNWKNAKDSIKLLLENGADPNVESDLGAVPLHMAASYGQLEAIKLLLKYGANINKVNSYGYTPLMNAVRDSKVRDNTDAIKLLLKKGADVNIKNNKGETALDIANKNDLPKVANLLRKYGAK